MNPRRRVSFYLAPRNWWVGLYFGPSAVFIQLLPMLGVRIGRPGYRWETGPTPKRTTRVYVEPRDLWVGVYVEIDAVYVCPLPLLVLRVARQECRHCKAWVPWWNLGRMCSVCSWRTSMGGSPRRPPADL